MNGCFRYMLLTFMGLLMPINSYAVNCGTQGAVYPIKEKSALELIQQRLAKMQAKGEIEMYQQQLKSQALNTVERPKPVQGLIKTKHARVFEKDISISVPVDIKGPNGEVIQRAGTWVNPLNNPWLSTRKVLIFLDGEDEKQVEWALQEHQKRRGLVKLVLVNGPVMQLMRDFEVPFYFDQSGRLTRYFGFQQIPAMVYQKGDKLMVAEIKV